MMFPASNGISGRLLRSNEGVAATEFALSLPFLLISSLVGLELANQTVTQMQISQLAIHIADNVSRIGDTSMLENRQIYESDINDLFLGANIQGGQRIDFSRNGRVILSSLEVVPGTTDEQYIHWQRCMGLKTHASSYGDEGDGLSSNFPGMGPAGEEVITFPDEAVMFVEISYDYQPLIGEAFAFAGEMQATASFTVRNDRDLAQIYQRDTSDPDPVAACSAFTDVSFATAGG